MRRVALFALALGCPPAAGRPSRPGRRLLVRDMASGLAVLVRGLAAGTTTVVDPAAPLGSFDTDGGALQPLRGPLCSLAPPAW